MSTPISQDSKLEGLDLYAPRRARNESASADQPARPEDLAVGPSQDELSQHASSPDAPSEELPGKPESQGAPPAAPDQEEPAGPNAVAAAQLRLDQAIRTVVDISHQAREPKPPLSGAKLPRAPNLKVAQGLAEQRQVAGQSVESRGSSASVPPRGSRLQPDIVPEPPAETRHGVSAATLLRFGLMVAFAALIASGITVMSSRQPASPPSKAAGTSIAPPDPRIEADAAPEANTAAATTIEAKTETARIEPGPPASRLIVEDQQAFANEPLPLGISVAHAVNDESLMFDGLAAGTRLSAGAPTSPSRWHVPLQQLEHLYLYAPADFVGVMNTAVDLLSANQKLVDSRAVRLEWRPKKEAAIEPSRPAPDNSPSAPLQTIGSDEAAVLMSRAEGFLQAGDITAARLMFLRLSDAGIADGAFAAATTYDPHYLVTHNVIGVRGDAAKARALYQRAAQLGSTAAGRELARMDTK